MKLLLDANISWKLCVRLKAIFKDCYHVNLIELPQPAQDIDIWNYALKNNLIIITNDDDFLNLSNIKGFPPKAVLLRTGNQTTNYIEQLLITHKTEIEALGNTQDYGILELF